MAEIEVYLNAQGDNLRFPVCPSEVGKNVNADISGEKIIKKGTVNYPVYSLVHQPNIDL